MENGRRNSRYMDGMSDCVIVGDILFSARIFAKGEEQKRSSFKNESEALAWLQKTYEELKEEFKDIPDEWERLGYDNLELRFYSY